MKVLYDEGLATHVGPESCGHLREGVPEALTGEHAGWAMEPRKQRIVQGADAVRVMRKATLQASLW